jgi:hypothetical protein
MVSQGYGSSGSRFSGRSRSPGSGTSQGYRQGTEEFQRIEQRDRDFFARTGQSYYNQPQFRAGGGRGSERDWERQRGSQGFRSGQSFGSGGSQGFGSRSSQGYGSTGSRGSQSYSSGSSQSYGGSRESASRRY